MSIQDLNMDVKMSHLCAKHCAVLLQWRRGHEEVQIEDDSVAVCLHSCMSTQLYVCTAVCLHSCKSAQLYVKSWQSKYVQQCFASLERLKKSMTTWSIIVNLNNECCLLYLTIRHAAISVQSAPVRSSGSEKGWQGLKVRRISALTGMFSADTGFRRPRKPSASPMAFRLITPLPSFMMHLQGFTLKHPDLFGWGERAEENMIKPTESASKTLWRLMVTASTSAEDSGTLCVVG